MSTTQKIGSVTSPASEILAITIDTTAPVAPAVVLALDSGESSTDNITDDGTLVINGVEAGATIEYSRDGVNWSAGFTAVEGVNTVYVHQIDKAGNVSAASTALTFTPACASHADRLDPSLNIYPPVPPAPPPEPPRLAFITRRRGTRLCQAQQSL